MMKTRDHFVLHHAEVSGPSLMKHSGLSAPFPEVR
jgi:hypothetical protein